MKRYRFIMFASLLLLFFNLKAQRSVILTDNPLKSSLDKAVHKQVSFYMQDSSANGVSIGILHDKTKHIYNYGEVKKNGGVLPTADNFYGIGSIDKVFATLLLAKAVVDNKVNLDDDIRKYLPNEYPNLTYNEEPLKIINLANHTSSLPRSLKIYPSHIRDSLRKLNLAQQVNFYGQYSRDSLLLDLHEIKLDTVPGTKYRYNNNDIKILVLLLENIYKSSYEDILSKYLRNNLDMYDTKTTLSSEEIERVSTGYFKGEPEGFVNFKGFIAGPAVISTVNDMLKYIKANLEVKHQEIQLIQQLTWGDKHGFGMGLGWMIDYEGNGDRYLYHSGNTRLGFNSICQFYPDKNWGIIIFVNDTMDLQKVGNIVNGIRLEFEK